jgi:hypothetical protein
MNDRICLGFDETPESGCIAVIGIGQKGARMMELLRQDLSGNDYTKLHL